MKLLKKILLVIVLAMAACFWYANNSGPIDSGSQAADWVSAPASVPAAFGRADSGHEVVGQGVVERFLRDDTRGDRHQRFILQLPSGQTVLVAHNIDLAPKILSLELGDSVRFKGEFIWNEKGGVVHWTHHDPDGSHAAGWLKTGGRTYQ